MMEFIKHNTTTFPDALFREADGLRLLAETLTAAGVTGPTDLDPGLRVPEVLWVSEQELAIPRIQVGSPPPGAMAALGRGLARLHRHQAPYFGLQKDNMIGLGRQINGVFDNWGEFFIQKRLVPQIERIADERVRKEFEAALHQSAPRLLAFLNTHCDRPSLLHGDLWSGNVLFDAKGPWLIDPAVYYGDSEADLAMTELFGGFSSEFYTAYAEIRPQSNVYELKRAIYNLYHTLNHYNLFGGGYLGACRKNLSVIEGL